MKEIHLRLPLSEIPEDKIVFYDWESDHQYAPYAKGKMLAVQYGFNGKPKLISNPVEAKKFRRFLAADDTFKVGFNNGNFDDLLSRRMGFKVNPNNRHDMFIGFKTIAPGLPGYSQKFISFYYLCDPHFPQMDMETEMREKHCEMHEVSKQTLAAYNKHDIVQLVNLFRMAWDVLIRPEHWDAYMLDIHAIEPLQEMQIEGGLYLDRDKIWRELQRLQKEVMNENKKALELTKGQVTNANSSQQLAKYLVEEDNIALELTDGGDFSVDKAILMDLRDKNPLAMCASKIREANGTLKYYENYLSALADETYPDRENWIPIQISLDGAKTRRFTSQSFYKLNFQNANKSAKKCHLVPTGFIGGWIDATQIENVVHIYESDDANRRRSYEANTDWNEYVWLCNEILGTDHDKAFLDDEKKSRSPQNPSWTIYKQYKTAKLMINFGAGVKKYGELFHLDFETAKEIMSHIHAACPAIKELQNKVRGELLRNGFVTDVFGHRYAGPPDKAYKVMAYLIQGCGTASLPKAQIAANYHSLRSFDRRMPGILKGKKCGVMTGTTHDENGFRIDLRLGDENILQLLQKMMFNMTGKFSHKFDDIPLRAKLKLSKTNEADAKEIDISDTEAILAAINQEI